MPAVLDTEEGKYVAKFRGAGQGAKALIAELIVAGLADALGLPLPEHALIEIDESFGRSEPDPEIQDILKGSRGINVGLRYLEGAFNFDPLAVSDISPELAAGIVWLDAFVTNIDRTPRNPNLLYWNERLWLIDHGAALYFHHNWGAVTDQSAAGAFPAIRNHVLLPFADDVLAIDEAMAGKLSPDLLRSIVEGVPDDLLMDTPVGVEPSFATPEENRNAYADYLGKRLGGERLFAAEAERARLNLKSSPEVQKGYRR